MACMDWDNFRREAAIYRQLAEKTENVGKQELLDLAAVCEEVANSIEDRLTGRIHLQNSVVSAISSAG